MGEDVEGGGEIFGAAAWGDVVIEDILALLNKNVETAQHIVRTALTRLPDHPACTCSQALRSAIITDRSQIPDSVKNDLDILIGKYL